MGEMATASVRRRTSLMPLLTTRTPWCMIYNCELTTSCLEFARETNCFPSTILTSAHPRHPRREERLQGGRRRNFFGLHGVEVHLDRGAFKDLEDCGSQRWCRRPRAHRRG